MTTIPRTRDFMEPVRLMAEVRGLKLRPLGKRIRGRKGVSFECSRWIISGCGKRFEWDLECDTLLVNRKTRVACRTWREVFAEIDKLCK